MAKTLKFQTILFSPNTPKFSFYSIDWSNPERAKKMINTIDQIVRVMEK